MNQSHILGLLEQGRGIQALAAFHTFFRSFERICARDFLLRARILAQIGFFSAAIEDINKALGIDPSDPDIVLFAAFLNQKENPEVAHELALQVLASVSTSQRHRRVALRLLEPKKLPLFLHSKLNVNDRITIVQKADQTVSVSQIAPSDFEEELGAAKMGETVLLGADIYVEKPKEGRRTLLISGLEKAHEISVEGTEQKLVSKVGRGTWLEGNPWIIMPVHDGGRVLARCIASVLAELKRTPRSKLMIVDDASKEQSTSRTLSAALKHDRVRVIRTSDNRGFVGAVNLGLRSIGPGPALILNSDTFLPKGTLKRLLFHLGEENIGTVTPLSNNAGSFSVPKARTGFMMPSESQIEKLSQCAFEQNAGISVDVINGNGFAMLISEQCLQEIGFLSNDFESGYYEEVDFCIRAATKGFRHVAAVDCFVGHVGANSFGSTKRKLVAQNYRLLTRKYPFYEEAYARYAQIDPLKEYCEALVYGARDWEPKKIPDVFDTFGANLLQVDVTEMPILLLKGDCKKFLERLHFRRIALIAQIALECFGHELRVTTEIYINFDSDEGFQIVHSSGEVIEQMSLQNVTAQDIAAFEDRVLEFVNGSQNAD